MAQVRDKHTSQVIFEGTPTECVLLAEKIGRDEVLFDDVGLAFNPDLVLKAHNENKEGLAIIAKDHKPARDSLAELQSQEKRVDDQQRSANKALKEARARIRE